MWCRSRDPTFSRFSRIPTCNRQADRQTDGRPYRLQQALNNNGLRPALPCNVGHKSRLSTQSGFPDNTTRADRCIAAAAAEAGDRTVDADRRMLNIV